MIHIKIQMTYITNISREYTFPFQTLAHEPEVLQQGLVSLNRVLSSLDGFTQFLPAPGSSVLLHELAQAQGMLSIVHLKHASLFKAQTDLRAILIVHLFNKEY